MFAPLNFGNWKLYPTLRNWCNYLSMLWLKSNHDSKGFLDDSGQGIWGRETAIWQTPFCKYIIYLYELFWFECDGPVNKMPSLVKIMTCHRQGGKPFSQPMMSYILCTNVSLGLDFKSLSNEKSQTCIKYCYDFLYVWMHACTWRAWYARRSDNVLEFCLS